MDQRSMEERLRSKKSLSISKVLQTAKRCKTIQNEKKE